MTNSAIHWRRQVYVLPERLVTLRSSGVLLRGHFAGNVLLCPGACVNAYPADGRRDALLSGEVRRRCAAGMRVVDRLSLDADGPITPHDRLGGTAVDTFRALAAVRIIHRITGFERGIRKHGRQTQRRPVGPRYQQRRFAYPSQPRTGGNGLVRKRRTERLHSRADYANGRIDSLRFVSQAL